MSDSPGANAPDGALRPTGRDEVVQATVKAAADLFAENNPSQVSVREIAARAGVSHALVHRYMGSKEDIFCAALSASREAAAEYWMQEHGMSETSGTFQSDLPPGRYVRLVVRAALDGVEMTPEDMKLPHADRMLAVLESMPFADQDTERGFDVRLLFSAVTAMAAGMAIAEEFFLVQSGLDASDHDYVYREMNRLIRRILAMADTSAVRAE